jgi:hypothetical protein
MTIISYGDVFLLLHIRAYFSTHAYQVIRKVNYIERSDDMTLFSKDKNKSFTDYKFISNSNIVPDI